MRTSAGGSKSRAPSTVVCPSEAPLHQYSMPEFAASHFRHRAVGAGAVEQTAVVVERRFGRRFVREGIGIARRAQDVGAGLPEAEVEFAAARAARERQHAVEGDAPGFVAIESPVEEFAQPAAVHALAVAIGVVDGAGQRVTFRRRAVLEEARGIAIRRETRDRLTGAPMAVYVSSYTLPGSKPPSSQT